MHQFRNTQIMCSSGTLLKCSKLVQSNVGLDHFASQPKDNRANL